MFSKNNNFNIATNGAVAAVLFLGVRGIVF